MPRLSKKIFAPAQTSAVGRYFGNITMLLFVVLGGHLMVLQAVVSSFETFPLGGSAFESINRLRLHELGAVVFRFGLWIALPMIGLLLFINMCSASSRASRRR